MSRNYQVARAVHHALIIGAVAAAGAAMPAFAQDTESATVDTVVVTGSRIRQPNLTTTSPVTTVTSADISAAGVTRVEDLVSQLPQAFATQNAYISNGSTGTATVDLRNLGSSRTLVLVNDRRMPYGGVTNSAADLNQIPTMMVDRVDILTGGASAVYGSDALSGVVNFILKKNFTGVQVDAQYNFLQHHNDYSGPGAVKLRQVIANRAATNPAQFKLPDSNVTDGYGRQGAIMVGVGTEDGRGNITAYATIRNNEAITQANRDYSACSLGATGTSFSCGGSGTSFPGRFTDFSTYNFTLNQTTGNTFRNFVNATDQYNFGPLNYYQRPDKMYNFGALGHYELNEHADVYTELMFTDYRTIAQIAPAGNFFATSTINCDNAMMSASQIAAIGCTAGQIAAGTSVPMYIGRRNVEGGPRQQDFHNSSFRGVFGVRGAISSGWNYDVGAQFSRVSANQTTNGYFVTARMARALDVVDTNPGPGVTLTCRSVVNGTDPACVPWNVFQTGQITQAALNYMSAPGLQLGVIDQEVINAQVNGDFGGMGGQLPWASEPIKAAFGAEYRRDKLNNQTDDLLTNFALSGTGGPTISLNGSTNVTDLFMEGRIPLVQDKTGAHEILLDVAYRYSDYGSSLTTDTYKFGGDWAPTQDIRFRASYQRAVRAANVIELFTAQGFNLFDIPLTKGDPCGATYQALVNPAYKPTQAQCVATGMTAAQFGSAALDSPAGQYNFVQGGNPGLIPETGDTISFGVILTPRFAPGLSVTLDYFDIKIKELISTVGAQNLLDACYGAGNPAACGQIRRDSAGTLWINGSVFDTNVNIGGESTKGVDVDLNYAALEMGRAGKLSFHFKGTRVQENLTDPLPGVLKQYDCVGLFADNCFAPTPKWRHHARVNWTTPVKGLDLALTWRYIGAVTEKNATATSIQSHFSAYNYIDLAGNWAPTDKIEARLGIENMFDKDPPLNSNLGTTGNGNTYPQAYAIGRYIFGGVQVKF